MAVEFRLLGDVEVHIDGRPVEVGHIRQRCVLVALLVDANRPVPVDQLVDRVWADRVPQRARNAVAGYLSRLRQVLAGTDEARIVRQPGGYVLAVDPMTVDLHRFHDLTARARAGGDPATSGRLLDQALALWRGEAFATLDTPWINSVRESLATQRLAALLDRNDVGDGPHAGLLAELSAAAVTHPLDERLAGQLMLALYRSGRQAEALQRYDEIRLRLADELGVDPGPTLQALHRQILTADPALTAATPPARPAPPAPAEAPVPRQLPAPPASFAGRERELAALDGLLTEADGPGAVVISALSGTAGVGKTALAIRWAHRVADRFPDGQLYVNLRGFDPTGSVMEPAEAIRGFLDALAVEPQRIPASLSAQVGLYRSLLAGRRMLLVLDNARDAEQVRPLLPGSPGCLAVVTSRVRLAGLVAADGARPLALDLLSPAEAHDLLAGRLGPDRLAAEPAAVDEIVARCVRLPLALAIVAARAATDPGCSLATVAAELADAQGGLDAFDLGDPVADVRTVFSWSYRALSDPAATLFRQLGLHPGADISVTAAASLAGLPPARVRPLLTELARANLLAEHSPGRYAFHDLLHAYAAEQARDHDSPADRRAALHRVLDHYLHTAYAADRRLAPQRDPITLDGPRPGVTPLAPADVNAAIAWFAAEQQVLLAAVQHAPDLGFDSHVYPLSWALGNYLDRHALWPDWAAVQHVALASADRLADRSQQARAHRDLARAYTRMGRHDDACTHLDEAYKILEQLGDRTGMAHTVLALSAVYEYLERYDKALDHAHQAHELYGATGDPLGQAGALNNIGWFLALVGEHEQALPYCQQSLTRHEELGDRDGQSLVWHSLGHIHQQLGDHRRAAVCYQRCIDLMRELGDRYHEALGLVSLGDNHEEAGQPGPARDAWRQAVGLLDALGHEDAARIRAKLDATTPRS